MSTSTGLYLPLQHAQSLTARLLTLLAPVCERIEPAGSLRRQRTHVHDIEFVVIPKMIAKPGAVQQSLFSTQPPEMISALGPALEMLVGKNESSIRWPEKRSLDGKKQKRFEVEIKRDSNTWIEVELWITSKMQFDGILLLRTGPAEFSKHMVTSQVLGGPLPYGWRRHQGYMTHDGQRVPITEQEWFELCGYKYHRPEKRDTWRTWARRVLA